MAGAGGAIGLLLGGLLTEYLNWRWTLFVNLVIAAVALLGALRPTPEPPARGPPDPRPPRYRAWPVPACSCWSRFLASRDAGLELAARWVSLFVGCVLLVAFVWWQRRAHTRCCRCAWWANATAARPTSAMFITGAGIFGVFLFLTYYLQQILRYSPVKTGLAFLPMVAALMVAAQVATISLLPAGRCPGRWCRWACCSAGSACSG